MFLVMVCKEGFVCEPEHRTFVVVISVIISEELAIVELPYQVYSVYI